MCKQILAIVIAFISILATVSAQTTAPRAAAPAVDWAKANAELLRHFQALIRIDTQDPPGNETKAVTYIKQILEADGIPVTVAAKDSARANAIARIKGNGGKRRSGSFPPSARRVTAATSTDAERSTTNGRSRPTWKRCCC